MAFSLPITIRFQHCDMAGIVFYPRYFEMFNLVVEEWFEQVIGVGFRQLHAGMRLGVPTVRINTEFQAMSIIEDIVVFTLTVKHIGNSSVDLVIQAVCDGQVRCNVQSTLVCVNLDSQQANAWPPSILANLKTG